MSGDSDAEVDVDSLFEGLADESKSAEPDTAHGAITMRPRGFNRTPAKNVRPVAPVGQRVDLLTAVVLPAPRTRAESAMAAVAGEGGVIGVIVREGNGHLSSSGDVDFVLEERGAYLARLAAMVGEELGLDSFRELHVTGTQKRLAWVANADGSSATVLASHEANVVAIARKLPR